MKILNTKRINERIAQAFQIRDLELRLNGGLIIPINEQVTKFEEQELQNNARMFMARLSNTGVNCTLEQAMLWVMVISVLSSCNEQMPNEVIDMVVNEARIFSVDEIKENSYLKNISFDNFDHAGSGRYELTKLSYIPYELFVYDSPFRQGLLSIPRIGCFTEKFEYPCIKESDMAQFMVTPKEIYTMKRNIEQAAGNVVTLGCGIGYYAYMVSEKEEVQSVTIVEKNEEVIELFETYILPQFAHKDKIKVIHGDELKFMEELDDGEFDCCFVALRSEKPEVKTYEKLKKTGKKFHHMKISYWLEEEIGDTLINYVWMDIMENYGRNNGIEVPAAPMMPEEEQFSYDLIKKLLMEETISKPEHVDYYLDYRNIIGMI